MEIVWDTFAYRSRGLVNVIVRVGLIIGLELRVGQVHFRRFVDRLVFVVRAALWSSCTW